MIELLKMYTKYCIACHMVFYVTMVTFQMTFSMKKYTSIVMEEWIVNAKFMSILAIM